MSSASRLRQSPAFSIEIDALWRERLMGRAMRAVSEDALALIPEVYRYYEIIPPEALMEIAARHRAHAARGAGSEITLEDEDLPFVDDGANW